MVTTLMGTPGVTAGLAALDGAVADVIEEAIAICLVPAPPFQETRRAAHVSRRMQALGLGDPRTDAEGDVISELPGAAGRPTVVLMAHLDTVFGPEVSVAVRREGRLLHGPGIGDNSMGLAAMLWLGRALRDLPGRGTLVLGANVGEEGLGNLRGARALWDQYGRSADAWVILEGAMFNHPSCVGVCSRRLKVTYRGQGGHSWSDFGRPSAIHALGRLIDQIAQIRVPSDPRTTYNVGVIQGGRTVNTIAPDASLILDMRSEEAQAVADLERTVQGLIGSIAEAAGVKAEVEVVGERAGGRLPPGHRIMRLVEEAAAAVGVPATWKATSTDANVPLSHGASAVCLGIAHGENLHSEDEVLDVSLLPQGLRQTYLVLAALLLGV
ncbi:MAG: M20/M25/M40 family metallo-hydrolase [Armatimonadetes bacterium]|nr:M20/M25/M40 family metallo-hydrolase [Armatimonadota bacterium]